MKSILISSSWRGGTSRVTISRNGDNAVIKLLTHREPSTNRQYRANISGMKSINTVTIPASEKQLILDTAIEMAKSVPGCWIWDSCNMGIADLYNKPFNDEISF